MSHALSPEEAEAEVIDTVLMLDSLGLGLGGEAFRLYQEVQSTDVYMRTLRIARPWRAWDRERKARMWRGEPEFSDEFCAQGTAIDDAAEAVRAELVQVWTGLRERLLQLWERKTQGAA
jgi:hypothetical protein